MWQICSNISLPIITFNLQFLTAFVYSHSRIPANTLPIQKASFSKKQAFSEMTERVLMETKPPDTFSIFATQPDTSLGATGCPWVFLGVSWGAHSMLQGVQSGAVMVQSALTGQWPPHKAFRCHWNAPLYLLPAWLILALQDAGQAQTLPGQCWICHREQGGLWTLPTSAHQLHCDSAPWMKRSSSCGDLLGLPRALLHPGMAWAVACTPAQRWQTCLEGGLGWSAGAGCAVLLEMSCSCPALSPQQTAVLSVNAILPLGRLTTRQSLIAPIICLSQQAVHPKQGD